jgi:hypothetical protein
MNMKMTAFWDIAQYNLLAEERRFRSAYNLHRKGAESPIALMNEAVSTSETSVHFETTRRNIPEGCYLHVCNWLNF